MFALRILVQQRVRFALTVGGVALCVLLMLFLFATYLGARDGSVDYIRRTRADLWVLQKNATNILRGSSILSSDQGRALRGVPGVKAASPVLLVLCGVRSGDQAATLFVAGFDPATGDGGPPGLAAGRSVRGDGEIVLDVSFAAKHGYGVGDSVALKDQPLEVVGLSTGTNALVIQYAFVSLRRAQSLMGVPDLATCFLVTVARDESPARVAASVKAAVPGVEVYGRGEFLVNNVREMESGILPLLYTVAGIGAVVLMAVLALLLTISLLEQRRSFAVLKTLGAPLGYLPRLVVSQALWISSCGSALAVAALLPLLLAVEYAAPEVSLKSSWTHVAIVVGATAALSLLGSWPVVRRLSRVYPLEAFVA